MAYSKPYLLKTDDITILVETANLGEKWKLTEPKEESADAIDAGANMNKSDTKEEPDNAVDAGADINTTDK